MKNKKKLICMTVRFTENGFLFPEIVCLVTEFAIH